MPIFARTFDTDGLADWDGTRPGNAVRALFDRWALPGTAGGADRLRVGIRDGYLNLYAKGQSVAKLSIGRAGPRVAVHRAYVDGRSPGDGGAKGQAYVTYDADALATPATAALVPGWIAAAERHASAEKRFVDDLVAANAGVIDLEMGLPASDGPGADRVAPRMDLVVAQVAGAAPSIAFWEAKCANNPELRISGDAAPRVLGQLDKYVDWMTATRVAEIQAAYRRTAEVLIALHGLYRPGAGSACLAAWRTLAAAASPVVVVRPGVVIGNYWPGGSREQVAHGRMAQAAASFARKGHRDKLARTGVVVHEVGTDHAGPALPSLTAA